MLRVAAFSRDPQKQKNPWVSKDNQLDIRPISDLFFAAFTSHSFDISGCKRAITFALS
jgi:hypothetical protein